MDRNDHIEFIYNKINDLNHTDRKTIGKLLYLNDVKMTEKGCGIQFEFNDITDELLKQIYDFIEAKFNMPYPF